MASRPSDLAEGAGSTIEIEARGSIHRISYEVAELCAFNIRAFSDEYLTDEERLGLADKFEDVMVGKTTGPLRFTEAEALGMTKHVDILMAGPHRSPDLEALFWALRGTDPPTKERRDDG